MLEGGVNICSFTMETTMQSLHITNVDSFSILEMPEDRLATSRFH